jgi:hypothetical protein
VPGGTIPLVPLTGVIVNEPSLQLVVPVKLFIEGLGVTETSKLKFSPLHPVPKGDTV